MKSKKMQLIESGIRKIVNRVLSEAYSDGEHALEELILFAENESRLYDVFNVKIYSNFEHLVAPSTQEAIAKACVNYGAKKANLGWVNENTDDDPIYDVYDERGDYVFSIDTDGDVIFDR